MFVVTKRWRLREHQYENYPVLHLSHSAYKKDGTCKNKKKEEIAGLLGWSK